MLGRIALSSLILLGVFPACRPLNSGHAARLGGRRIYLCLKYAQHADSRQKPQHPADVACGAPPANLLEY